MNTEEGTGMKAPGEEVGRIIAQGDNYVNWIFWGVRHLGGSLYAFTVDIELFELGHRREIIPGSTIVNEGRISRTSFESGAISHSKRRGVAIALRCGS